MDIWENASLTEKGADLQNKLINGETLKITKVKTGAGKVSAMYLRQQTEVANPVQELTIQPATIADDNIIIPVLLDNIGLTESYELWQVGFYAEDPDEGEILYCIAQAAKGKDIPTEQESPGYSIVWNFHFKNSEENPFELSITPAGLTSMRTFQEHANNVDIHVTLEEKNIFSDKYTKAEIDNKFSAFETNIDWKEAVDTYTDILEMYPKPQDGWTVNVKDTDYTYRFNGTDWVAISSNSIPNATSELNGLMTKEQAAVLNKLDNAVGSLQNLTTSEKQNLVGAVNEVKSQVTQLNSDLYPVGIVLAFANGFNPNSSLQGTWEPFAKGQTLVGVNETDTDFNYVKKAGGHKKLHAHSHGKGSLTADWISLNGIIAELASQTSGIEVAASGICSAFMSGSGDGYGTSKVGHAGSVKINASHSHNVSGSTSSSGGGNSENLQPYITVFYWVRVS
ncbi:phage baseplate protein [Anaerostipes caccae]|uniref:phage baseplate protein n=1 Tax=Anaerostipes caccae TaxID=105841 RepID=UPI0038D39DED